MLKTTSITAPLALLAAFTLMSTPSFAQQREHGRQNPSGQQSSGQAAERAQPRTQAPAQAPAPQAQAQAPAPRAQAQAPRPQVPAQAVAPRDQSQGPRGVAPSVDGHRYSGQHAVPRRDVIVPRYNHVPDGRYAPRYAPRYYAPRY